MRGTTLHLSCRRGGYEVVIWGIMVRHSTEAMASHFFYKGGADKSLARHNSRCRGTESIVSLERGDCSCDELQVFSCYGGWKEAYQATHAISKTWSCHKVFFPLRDKAPKEHSDRNMHHRIQPSKTGWPSLDGWLFHLWCTSSWTTQQSDHHGDYWWNSRANLGRLPDSVKAIAEQLGISRERAGSIVHEDLDMRKLSAKWVPKCPNADQKRQRYQSSEQLLEFFRRDPNDFLSRLVTMDETWLWPGDKATINGVAT